MSVSDAGHVRNDDATADEALANGGRMGSQRLVLCPDRLARRLPRANAITEATLRPKSTLVIFGPGIGSTFVPKSFLGASQQRSLSDRWHRLYHLNPEDMSLAEFNGLLQKAEARIY